MNTAAIDGYQSSTGYRVRPSQGTIEGFVRCRPVNSKIPEVDGKHGFDVLLTGQMNERGVGELGLETPILFQDRSNLNRVCLIQLQNSVQTEGRRLQQFPGGARIVSKPGK